MKGDGKGKHKEAQLIVMEVSSRRKTMVKPPKSSEALKNENFKHLSSLLQYHTTPKLS